MTCTSSPSLPPVPCTAPVAHPPPAMTEPHPMAKKRRTEQPSDEQSETLLWLVLHMEPFVWAALEQSYSTIQLLLSCNSNNKVVRWSQLHYNQRLTTSLWCNTGALLYEQIETIVINCLLSILEQGTSPLLVYVCRLNEQKMIWNSSLLDK